jgi:glycosyltransferase involved in cell wall biosynthesis
MSTTGVSVVVHTLNPGPMFHRSLASVAWADEIIVLDMGSDDGTAEHALHQGARVVPIDRVPYVELVRQRGLDEATQAWTLVLDPDEIVSPALKHRLVRIAAGEDGDAALVPRQNWFFGRPALHGAFGPGRDLQLRFFRSGTAHWPTAIHALPVLTPTSRVVRLERGEHLEHFAYASASQFLQKMDRYTDVDQPGPVRSPLGILVRRLANDLVRLQGWRDGRLGVQLAVLMAAYDVVGQVKAVERTGLGPQVAARYLASAEALLSEGP